MKAVIIENETAATRLLTKIIVDYCPSIEIVGTAVSIKEGFQLLSLKQPDVVFMDIELDDGQSFELLDMMEKQHFHIIFTTAYDQYALKAFRYDAVDYLLKPYMPKTVVAAVERVQDRFTSNTVFKKLHKIIEGDSTPQRISLSTSKGIRMCAIEDIKHIEAAASYCNVILVDDEKILISKSLSELEKLLPKDHFFRVHASHTVNLAQVKNVINEDGGYVELHDGSQVPLARRRKQEFIDQLK